MIKKVERVCEVIAAAPDSDGYWWWRKSPSSEWQLASVTITPFMARFFSGSRISSAPWGEWQRAEVRDPIATAALEPAIPPGYAVVDPHIAGSGGCSGYDVLYRGSAKQCAAQQAKHGLRIITDDKAQDEVAWAESGKWTYDDPSIFG